MGFDTSVKSRAMVACGRCCCICHCFKGTKMECHHIKPEDRGGPDTYENCIPLCFDCHGDQMYDSKHPKGTKYSEAELREHRDRWYAKVAGSPAVAYHAGHQKADAAVYAELVRLLPWDGAVDFIRSRNFDGWSFERSGLNDFLALCHRSTDPAFEFVDTDLESLRAGLMSAADALLKDVGRYTYPCKGEPNCNEVPEEWEEKQPEKYRRAVAALESNATNVCDAYDKLVRLAKRKLAL